MITPNLPLHGRCRCGAVKLRVTALPILTMACHCRGCQRMSASAYSLSAAIPTPGFEITAGEPVVAGLRDPQQQHFFCPQCMTWLFTRFLPEFVNLRVTMLDQVGWYAPFIETYTEAQFPWARTGALRSFSQFPAPEEFASLTRDFARAIEMPERF